MELTPKLKLAAAATLLVTFTGGIFAGRELMKAEIANSIKTALEPQTETTKPDKPEEPTKPKVKSDRSSIKAEVNPIEDTTKYTLAIHSTNENANSIGMLERDSIVIRCEAGETDLYIVTSAYVSSDSQSVKVRYDKGEVNKQWWNGASGGSALFSNSPLSTMVDMFTHKQMTIGYKPWRETEDFATFDLEPYHKDIDQMMKHCKK